MRQKFSKSSSLKQSLSKTPSLQIESERLLGKLPFPFSLNIEQFFSLTNWFGSTKVIDIDFSFILTFCFVGIEAIRFWAMSNLLLIFHSKTFLRGVIFFVFAIFFTRDCEKCKSEISSHSPWDSYEILMINIPVTLSDNGWSNKCICLFLISN